MMTSRYNLRVAAAIIIVLFLFLLPSPVVLAGSERILIKPQTIKEGEEAKVVLKLDSAPNGLSGYDITIFLENGMVADILRVDFPKWANLSLSSVGHDSAKLRAVDLEDEIKPGATDVELATIVLVDTKQGESLIKIVVNKMDDDYGDPIEPFVEHGRLIVKGDVSSLQALFFTLLIATVVVIVIIAVVYLRRGMKAKLLKEKKL